jgi:hypothetical protein
VDVSTDPCAMIDSVVEVDLDLEGDGPLDAGLRGCCFGPRAGAESGRFLVGEGGSVAGFWGACCSACCVVIGEGGSDV